MKRDKIREFAAEFVRFTGGLNDEELHEFQMAMSEYMTAHVTQLQEHLDEKGIDAQLSLDELESTEIPLRFRMLAKIAEFKSRDGFGKGYMRWKNIYLDIEGKQVHISQVKFELLTNAELLEAYELIVRRMTIMM